MKVLVTGGAGFIGSHIVDSLIQRGHDVIVVDDLSNGSLRNLNPSARFYQISICDRNLAQVFRKESPDIVCHQAAHTIVTNSVRDPSYDAGINIIGSLNLLDNCVQFKVRKIIYASSCAIYGNPEYLPIDEKHPINPLSPYGVSKYSVEKYLQCYHAIYGIHYAVLRYANVYGPRQNTQGEAGVVATFAHKMLSNQTCTIFGSGDKTRAYVFVGDVARANLIAVNKDCEGIYNIGTDSETADQQIFNLLSKEMNYQYNPNYAPIRPGEITHMCLDYSRAQSQLGWQPQIHILNGIHITAKYYTSEHSKISIS